MVSFLSESAGSMLPALFETGVHFCRSEGKTFFKYFALKGNDHYGRPSRKTL